MGLPPRAPVGCWTQAEARPANAAATNVARKSISFEVLASWISDCDLGLQVKERQQQRREYSLKESV